MKSHRLFGRQFGMGAGLAAALLCLPLAASLATPTMDGEIDAEYTKIATSPKDNLQTAGLDVNNQAYNDQTNPIGHTLDVTNMWAANSGSDLYVYVEMPYLDLNIVQGEFAIVFHLGGANDTLERAGAPNDPYGAPCDYGHVPATNAVLKSNMAGFKHAQGAPVGFDGNQGYAFLNSMTTDAQGWVWDTGNFLFSGSWTDDTVNNLIHGTGLTGGEIVYKAGKGIEIKIPLALFHTGDTQLQAPQMGDPIKMQFYDNIRYYSAGNVTNEKYPRPPVDAVPFESSVFGDTMNPLRGFITTYATYTLQQPTALSVSSFTLADPLDTGHLAVAFSAPVGDGATTASNYVVTDKSTGATVPVTSATVDPNNTSRVILGLTFPFSTKLNVTVSNVKGANGVTITPPLGGDVNIGTPVQLNLYDPHGALSSQGNDPATSQPYGISATGDPIGWRNNGDGTNEIQFTAVSGETGHLRSNVFIAPPGIMGYKYRVPHLGNWDNWNALNPKDHRSLIPVSATPVQISDNAANEGHNGPLTATFTLIDLDDLVKGRAVYLAGDFQGWTDQSTMVPMPAVPDKPHTYSATFALPSDFGQDLTTEYKYAMIVDDPDNPGSTKVLYDDLNPQNNRRITFKSNGQSTYSVTDVYGGSRFIRILRAAAGFNPAPQPQNGYYTELDADLNGSVTVLDAVKALHP